MTDLITYVHGVPVRKSGVAFQQIIREYAKYVETGLTPEAVSYLLDQQDNTTRVLESEIGMLKDECLRYAMKLEEYESVGSLALFRLLKNKYKNGELK